MTPKISVIVPCLNEEKFLRQCLESIINQSLNRNMWELMVVDNGSNDGSQSIAKKLADRMIVADHCPVGAARNAGANQAMGDILVFIDADCLMDDNWLERAYRLSCEYPSTALGGAATLPTPAVWVERYWLLETPMGTALPKDLLGCSIVIPAELFHQINGFNNQLISGEDSDLSRRLKAAGASVRIISALNVTHMGNAKTISEFIKRQIWHAQSYRHKGLANFTDPVFLIVVTFIFCCVSAILASINHNLYIGVLLLTTSLGMPTILTVKRFHRAGRLPSNLIEALSAWTLDLTYIAGRAIGLIRKAAR